MNLTDEQRAIAQFWADGTGQTGTPPGHWISILGQVLQTNQMKLDVAAEAYAKVGLSVMDAFICCWHLKYEYSLLRPITYIQSLFDPNWNAFITTPPFPEYTSGHSTQSAAAAQVLTDMFGDMGFTDHTFDGVYPPRTFDSFWDAAEESAISRLYGGIHYRTAIERGLVQGRDIGTFVSALSFGPRVPENGRDVFVWPLLSRVPDDIPCLRPASSGSRHISGSATVQPRWRVRS